MAEHIGLEAIFGTELFERGIDIFMSRLADAVSATQRGGPAMGEAVSQGVDQMTTSTDRMATSMGQAGGGVDAFAQIAIGALRKIGEAAIEYLGQAISALADFATGSLQYAMEAETVVTRLDAVLAAGTGEAVLAGGGYDDLQDSIMALLPRLQDTATAGAFLATDVSGATDVILDLAQAMGIDATRAADLLALAQADPIAGMRALRLEGIEFDSAQRRQIRTMVQAGNDMGAFALILGEVGNQTSQVTRITLEDLQAMAMQYRDLAGGSDEAVMGIEAMALRMGNISREQMPGFIQTVLDLAAVTGRDYPDAARMMAQAQLDPVSAIRLFRSAGLAFTAAQREQISTLQESGDEAGAFALIMERVSEATQGAAARMADTTAGRLEILRGHWEETREQLMAPFLPAIQRVAEDLIPVLQDLFERYIVPNIPTLERLATAFGQAFAGLVGMDFGAVRDALADIGIDIQPLADIWDGIVGAWEEAQPILGRTVGPLLNLFGQIGDWWETYGPGMMEIERETFAGFAEDIANLGAAIQPFVEEVLTTLSDWWAENGPLVAEAMLILKERSAAIFGWLGDQLPGIWATIQPILGGLLDIILGLARAAAQIITGDWAGVWQTIKDTAARVWAGIEEAIGAFADWVASWFGTTWAGIVEQWQTNWDMFTLIVNTVWETIKTAVRTKIDEVIGAIRDTIARFIMVGADLIGGLVQGIVNAAGRVVTAVVNAVRDSWEAAMEFLGIESPSTLFADIGKETMVGLAQGVLKGMEGPRRAIEVAATYAAAPAMAASQGVAAPALMGGRGDTYYYDSHNEGASVSIHGADLSNPFVIRRIMNDWLAGS